MKNSRNSLGIDIGSVTLKLALIDEHGNMPHASYEKHYSRPLPALLSALRALKDKTFARQLSSVGVTGSGKELVKNTLGLLTVNEIVAQAAAASYECPGVKTIIEIGGQDSKFIRLGGRSGPEGQEILVQNMNDICAAGTGAFIEQQAERMGIPIEAFGKIALEGKNPAFVAGRCAVFSKTDIVHLRQEGVALSDIAAGICNAVARNYKAQFSKGRDFDVPIIFQGGVAANHGVVKAFRAVCNVSDTELVVPKRFAVMGAIGAAIISRQQSEKRGYSLDFLIDTVASQVTGKKGAERVCSRLPRLFNKPQRIDTRPRSAAFKNEDVFIGIDVGSTSTCVAVLGGNRRLLAQSYMLNKGSVMESVDAALDHIKRSFTENSGNIRVSGVGVTGSGRYLISHYIGADVVKEEISAQAKAAVHMLPDVDTVFEIGGQDSKYIRISNGRVVDFRMNKVCAAGTGAFLQEQAERLGVKIEEFGTIALASGNPADLGSRCTVFMESDVINYQQMGVRTQDIIAGLSYSVARNYLEKVVAGKQIGRTILFLGGVAFNESVVSAFQQLLNKRLIVPEHHAISAAIGMALIAEEEMSVSGACRSAFKGFDRRREDYEITSFQCADCQNACRINRIQTSDGVFHYGGACDKYEKNKKKPALPNLFKEREALLLSYLRPVSHRHAEQIGIARVQLFYELFPLWCVFLQELGYAVVVSDPTNSDIINDGLEKTSIDNCFASKVVYGHMRNLLKKGVSKVFSPSVIEFERRVTDLERNFSCPHIQAIPSLIKSAFPSLDVISPVFVRDKKDTDWQKELKAAGRALGKKRSIINRAVRSAARAHSDFQKRREQLGTELLKKLPSGRLASVVMGKTYNVCDPGLNLAVADKLLNMNVVPVPFDCLPLSEQELPKNYMDLVWASGQDLIRAAKVIMRDQRLHPLLITNFGCGPDSFTIKYLDELFRDKSFLVVEVDEHTSGVGVVTRIEAFLNTIQKGANSDFQLVSKNFKPFLPSPRLKQFDKLLYVPVGFDSYRPIAAAFESIGVRTKMLPLHDEETERWGRMYSSGTECLPYIMHVGDAFRMTQDPEFSPDRSALYLPASDLGCRVSLFSTSMRLVLRDLGYPEFPVIAPRISMDKDEFLKIFGLKFVKTLIRGMFSVEFLARKLTEVRPYEKKSGESDEAYEKGIHELCGAVNNGGFWTTLNNAVKRFDDIETNASQQRPIIGLVGDDYTRGNSFANNNVIKEIETLGGEVWNVPIWSSYLEFQMGMKPRKMLRRGRYVEFAADVAKAAIGHVDIRRINRVFDRNLKCNPDGTFLDKIALSAQYLDEKSEPVAIIALAHAIQLMNHGVDGLLNLVGFQCMIHSIVTASLRTACEHNGSVPVLTISFDFQEKIHQRNRLEAFMYQVKQHRRSGREAR